MAHAEKFAAMHAIHAAKLERRTPGLRCPLPSPNETCDQTRARLSRIAEDFQRLRSAARQRAIAAGCPGITAATSLDVQPWDGAHDPVGDFMRAEVADQPLSRYALAAE